MRLAGAEEAGGAEQTEQGEQAQQRWHLSVVALTDVPIHVGGQLTVEMPYRIRASTSLGVLPGPYVDLINAVVVAAGGYDDATAEIIANALHRSLVWRLHVGWRPFRRHGLYFEVGYTLITLGGQMTSEDVLVLATGQPSPIGGTAAGERGYDIGSTLHMIDVEVGWELLFWDHFVVRFALGFAGTVGAHTETEPNYDSLIPRVADEFGAAAGAYLDEVYRSYVFSPVLSVALGYRFF